MLIAPPPEVRAACASALNKSAPDHPGVAVCGRLGASLADGRPVSLYRLQALQGLAKSFRDDGQRACFELLGGEAILKWFWDSSKHPRDDHGRWSSGDGEEDSTIATSARPGPNYRNRFGTKTPIGANGDILVPMPEAGQSNRDWWAGLTDWQKKRVAVRALFGR